MHKITQKWGVTFLGVQVNLHGGVATGVEYLASVDLQDRHGSGSAEETVLLSGSTGWTHQLPQLLPCCWLKNSSGKTQQVLFCMKGTSLPRCWIYEMSWWGLCAGSSERGWRIYGTQRKVGLVHQKWRKGAQPCCLAQPCCQMLWKASWEYYQPTVKQESVIPVSSNKWMTCTAKATTALCTGYTKADTRWRPQHALISHACTVGQFQGSRLNKVFSQTAGNCCIDLQWCANSPEPIHHLNAWMEPEQSETCSRAPSPGPMEKPWRACVRV